MAVGGEDAALSHESALTLLDLSDNIPDAVHILVPRRRHGLRVPAGVRLHTHADRMRLSKVWRDGLPITAPPRTLADVAGRIQPEQLQMAIRQALWRGLLTADELREEAQRRHKRAVLEALDDGGASP
jgi:predicted transcriptional regulator of viral defense system